LTWLGVDLNRVGAERVMGLDAMPPRRNVSAERLTVSKNLFRTIVDVNADPAILHIGGRVTDDFDDGYISGWGFDGNGANSPLR
jgi:hypothetical protein